MKILVCYKWVLDEQDIKIVVEDLSLDSSRVKYKISDYDKNAIETAMSLATNEDSVETLTFGNLAVKKSLKDVLSRGPAKANYIMDNCFDTADVFVTANILAAAVKKEGPYDLIICGEGSSDTYNQQIASRLAVLLNMASVTFVKEITKNGSGLMAVRKLDDCTEEIMIGGPAVISVLPEINKPRIPTLKEVLSAARKPSVELKLSDLALSAEDLTPKTVRICTKGFVMNRKNIIYKDSDAAVNVRAFVAALKQEGVI